jgi:trimeric autotransporter adhesin
MVRRFKSPRLCRTCRVHLTSLALLLAAGLPAAPALAQGPVGTSFTFQGDLRSGGAAVTTATDFQFRLFDAATGGTQIGSLLAADNIALNGGRFVVDLDFGSAAFAGQARFLEIAVRTPAGSGTFTTLEPRQPVHAAPYAIFSQEAASAQTSTTATQATNASNAAQLAGQPAAFYTNASNLSAGTLSDSRLSSNISRLNAGQTFTGPVTFSNSASSFLGSGAGLIDLNASNLSTGTLPDARLSSNVARLNTAQTFAGATTFTAPPSFAAPAGAPFSVASSTLIPNLNADLLDGNDSAFFTNASNLTSGTLPSSRLSGQYFGAVNFPNTSNNFNGTYNGVGVGLTDLNASNLAFGTIPIDRLPTPLSLSNFASITPLFIANNGRDTLDATAIEGRATGLTAQNIGGRFESTSSSGRGVYGLASSSDAFTLNVGGLFEARAGFARAVWGRATGTSATNHGGFFESHSTEGRGVAGVAIASSGTNIGGDFRSNSTAGTGVRGVAAATSGTNFGVFGQSDSPAGFAVHAQGRLRATGASFLQGNVLIGAATGTPEARLHVMAASAGSVTANSSSSAVFEDSGANYLTVLTSDASERGLSFGSPINNVHGGIYYTNANGMQFRTGGNLTRMTISATGAVNVNGTLSKGGGSFKIDHPIDPENKYLYHSFVESPDMMNVYNGNITTGHDGLATVVLPDWFQALNRDFRYQLTIIDERPDLPDVVSARIVRKVADNSFTIRTNIPHVEVSWQITGIRKDPFANANRIPVEEDKPAILRGSYLHPAAWGKPEHAGEPHLRVQVP